MPDSFNAEAVLQALETLAGGLTDVQDAGIGVPKAFALQVSTYVTLAGPDIADEAAGGCLLFTVRALVGFAYRVGDNARAAELALSRYVVDFIRAFYADRTLGGLIENGRLDLTVNNLPEYRDWSGREVRHFFVIVEGQQRGTIVSA